MKFVVGLGNPGQEYERTRHNIGFRALDLMAEKIGASFSVQSKWKGEVAKKGEFIFIKPHTYMNLSGECVRKVVDFYDKSAVNEPSRICVIHDDLDLKFGQNKLVIGSGPKVHNGVNSVRTHLGTSDFWYGRIGIDGRDTSSSIPAQAYVLSAFTHEEERKIPEILSSLTEQIYAKFSS
jgi:peptidyl-tRNA hydrolase, PTH1 family